MATALGKDPELALEVHTREELGVNPESTGSPVPRPDRRLRGFALGALVPLLPWFFSSGTAAVVASVILGAVAALGIGSAVAYFTGRSYVRTALRQLGIAAVVAAVTYGIGTLVGTHTGA